jgi:hypothetical protein
VCWWSPAISSQTHEFPTFKLLFTHRITGLRANQIVNWFPVYIPSACMCTLMFNWASGNLVGCTVYHITVCPYFSLSFAHLCPCIFIFRHRRRSLVVVVGRRSLSLMKNSRRTHSARRGEFPSAVSLVRQVKRPLALFMRKNRLSGRKFDFFTAWLRASETFSLNQITLQSLGTSSSASMASIPANYNSSRV